MNAIRTGTVIYVDAGYGYLRRLSSFYTAITGIYVDDFTEKWKTIFLKKSWNFPRNSQNVWLKGKWDVKITSTLPHKALGSASFHESGMLRYFEPRAYRRTSTRLASPQSENGRALNCWSPGRGFISEIAGCPSPFEPSSGIISQTFFPNLRG